MISKCTRKRLLALSVVLILLWILFYVTVFMNLFYIMDQKPNTYKALSNSRTKSIMPSFATNTSASMRKHEPQTDKKLAEFIGNNSYKNMLFVTGANKGYQPLLDNVIKSLDHLKVLPKLTYIAESDGMENVYKDRRIPLESSHIRAKVVYGSKGFSDLVCKRFGNLLKLIRFNVTVLYVDVDTYFFKNPLPYFKKLLEAHPETDIITHSDVPNVLEKFVKTGNISDHNICSCIQFIRPKENVKKFYELLAEESSKACEKMNQYHFIKQLNIASSKGLINYRMLPPTEFPNGHDLFSPYFAHTNTTPVMAHANYALGRYKKIRNIEKAKRMYGTIENKNLNSKILT